MFNKIIVFTFLLLIVGCKTGGYIPQSNELILPTPIQGTSGLYMSPFTNDETICEWVTKANSLKTAGSVGKTIGTISKDMTDNIYGKVALSVVGKQIGDSIARSIAMVAIGGEEYLKSTSDLSFNRIEDLAVYLYVKYSTTREDYSEIYQATTEIYPELKTNFVRALREAKRK